LTYNVHAASTELATHEAVAFGFNPRRNRCFHSSICKVVRPLARAPAVLARWWARRSARGRPVDALDGVVTASATIR
jgi:hypothetical protein